MKNQVRSIPEMTDNMTAQADTPEPKASWKKQLLVWGKLLIFILVIVWVVHEIWKTSGEIAAYKWSLHWGWILLSCGIYFTAYLPAWIYWHLCMKTLGQKPHWFRSLRAYYIGHLGKYVPGKAVVVTLRTGLMHSEKTKISILVAAVFLETLTMMAVGVMVSCLLLTMFFHEVLVSLFHQQPILALAAAVMLIGFILTVIPHNFKRILLILGVGKKSPEVREKLNRLGTKTLVTGWFLMAVTWLILGVSLWTTIKGLGIDPGPFFGQLPRFIAAMSLSTVGGFLSLIPGGFGVRELILAGVMGNYFHTLTLPQGLTPEAAGLVLAGITRLISIFTELAVSTVLYPLGKWK
ncbi:MAG: flippase-like domain-containing protein [Planctomycetaceae bacterium]|jgi:uncharacterized membrane protein YbhN (UPF0104 family)|nr:flippase-like domain-containing protein [Planctomycetaceae bacterium]